MPSCGGVNAVFGTTKAHRNDPLVNEPSVLSRAEMARMIDAAGEGVVVYCATATLKPGEQAGPNISCQLELAPASQFSAG